MTKLNISSEFYSLPAMATYLGTAISIWALQSNYLQLALGVVSVLTLFLLLYLIATHRKYRYFKRFKAIDVELHKLSHRTRDYISELRMAENRDEARQISGAATKHALSVASKCFEILIEKPCCSSLMLPRPHKALKTVQYCYNADPQRESIPSDMLSPSDGIAGQAFTSGDVLVWSLGDTRFKEIRNGYAKYYKSGISIPFKAGLVYAGVLNVDCGAESGFDYELHKQVGATIADTVGIIIECLNLWGDANGGA